MAGRGVVIQITGDGESAKRALEMVQEHLRETAEESSVAAEQITSAMEMVKGSFEMVGIAIGIEEILDLFKEMVAKTVELGMEIGHLSKETGIAAEDLSVLKYASEKTGVSFEALTKGMSKLAKEMLEAEEGKKQAIQTFGRLGISQAEVVEHSNDLYGMLGLVADRFEKLPAGPQRSAEAVLLFGKAGMALVPFLAQGSEGMAKLRSECESLGLVLDEQGIKKFEEMHGESVKLTGALDGLSLKLTNQLAPALIGAAELIAKATGAIAGLFGEANKHLQGNFELPPEVAGIEGADLSHLRDQNEEKSRISRNEIAEMESANRRVVELAQERVKFAGEANSDVPLIRKAAQARIAAIDKENREEQAKLKGSSEKKIALQRDLAESEAMAAAARYQLATDSLDRARELQRQKSFDPEGYQSNIDRLTEAQAAARDKLIAAQAEKKAAPAALDLQDQSGGKVKALKSDDGIARAAAELVTEQAKASADAAKYLTQAELADLDAKHKLLITSDAEYYAEKMRLQTEALDAEQKALEARQASLGGLLKTQQGDKLLRRNKNGDSAEELKTKRELVQVQEQLDALKAKGQELESANTAQVAEAGWATELAGLKLAADLEKERNDGISAQIALIERETELRAQKVVGANGSSADEAAVRALGEQEKNKLRIGEVNRQITDTENDYKRAIEEVNDAAAKDPRLKRQAEKETSQLNQEEAESLRGLVVQYDALAQVLGGEYIEKAKQLHAELDKLSRPDQRDSAAFAKTLAEGVEGMTKRVVDATQQGRESFRQMVRGMEKDVLDLALKLAEQKWLTPMLEGGGGQLPKARIGGAGAAGQAGAGAAGIVNQVPQLYQPQASSSSALTSLLPKLLGKGAQPTASSSGFKVIIKLDNSTGQTLTARQTGQSFDGDSKEYIVNAILENVGQGGPLASLFSSMSTG